MNPYLRLPQKIRPSSYYYRELILESAWPEIGAMQEPSASVRLLDETPLGTRNPPEEAMAMWGIYLDEELVLQVKGVKWLGVAEGAFQYVEKRKEKRKSWNMAQKTLKGEPTVSLEWAPSEIYVNDLFGTARRPITGSASLYRKIKDALHEAYSQWTPPPPNDPQKLSAAIKFLMSSYKRPEFFYVPCVQDDPYLKLPIACAIWMYEGFTDNPMQPIFMVYRYLDYHYSDQVLDRVFLDPREAVEAALMQCRTDIRVQRLPKAEPPSISTIVQDLKEKVTRVIELVEEGPR